MQMITDPFVVTDSEKTEQSPQFVDGDAVTGKNTQQIHQQIWNKRHTAVLQLSSETLEFKDLQGPFQGLFKAPSTTIMHILKDTPVHC